MRRLAIVLTALALGASALCRAESVRIKDLGKISGWRDNALLGYGLVTGLAGTGDSPINKTTRQTIANLLAQFDLVIAPDQIQSRNVAVAVITASLPPFARPGDAIDVTVTSFGDARSLVGGSLLLAPLKAPNGRIYALAQGPISVGGYKYDLNGNVVQKNHPTVGSIPSGGVVEVGVTAQVLDPGQKVTFVLADPDYTTATRIAAAVNAAFGTELAEARDASAVEIRVSDEQRVRLSGFLTRVENLAVEPDRRARVGGIGRRRAHFAGCDLARRSQSLHRDGQHRFAAQLHRRNQPGSQFADRVEHQGRCRGEGRDRFRCVEQYGGGLGAGPHAHQDQHARHHFHPARGEGRGGALRGLDRPVSLTKRSKERRTK